MVTQQNGVREQLEKHGWEIVKITDINLEWWADEVWLLKSTWSPHGCLVFLTFVVDPQWDGPRKKGQGIWAVTAALEEPQQWSDVTLSLGRGWEKQLPEFFTALSKLRSQATTAS